MVAVAAYEFFGGYFVEGCSTMFDGFCGRVN